MTTGDEEEEAVAESVRAGTDAIAVPSALLEEKPVEQRSLVDRIRDMTVSERIKLALRGNKESRMILLRDSNKLIRRFVLQNPRITDEEIIALSKNRSADEELLRLLGALLVLLAALWFATLAASRLERPVPADG